MSWISCFVHFLFHVCHHVSFQLGSVVCVPSLAWAGHIKLINRRARTRKCDKLCENAVEQVQNGKRRRKMRYLSWSTRVCLNNSATARPICPIPAAEMWHLLQPFAICLQLFFQLQSFALLKTLARCEWSAELCAICLYLFDHFSGKTWHSEHITVRYLKRMTYDM